jgi:two-component system phosphate regulon sensor histidine kinase PhoR
MLEEADRMTRLVDTLLLLARSDAGALPLARSTVSLPELAREVVGTLAVLAEEKHLNVEVVGADARVPGDRTLLRQVFVNLVHNAILHSPRGATITVAIAQDDGLAECCVSDAGPGIAPQHRAHVFQRFYRADPARSQAAGGAGLGLALVRSIVELHGGTVVLVDRDGPGAVFCVRLPAEGAQPATASARPRPSP